MGEIQGEQEPLLGKKEGLEREHELRKGGLLSERNLVTRRRERVSKKNFLRRKYERVNGCKSSPRKSG